MNPFLGSWNGQNVWNWPSYLISLNCQELRLKMLRLCLSLENDANKKVWLIFEKQSLDPMIWKRC